jgi:hypothetical protein
MTPAARVVVQEDGGEGFLLNLDTGRYYSLNRTGVLVWRALTEGGDPVAMVQERFPAAPADQVQRDVKAVLDQLLDAALVRADPGG